MLASYTFCAAEIINRYQQRVHWYLPMKVYTFSAHVFTEKDYFVKYFHRRAISSTVSSGRFGGAVALTTFTIAGNYLYLHETHGHLSMNIQKYSH